MLYFYFDYRDNAKKCFAGMLKSVIAQLCKQDPRLLIDVVDLYDRCDHRAQRPTNKELQAIASGLFNLVSKIFLILDGVDESQEQQDVLRWITEQTRSLSEKLHPLVVSRREGLIIRNLGSRVWRHMSLDDALPEVSADIRAYIDGQIEQDEQLSMWSPSDKDLMTNVLRTKAKGMYVLRPSIEVRSVLLMISWLIDLLGFNGSNAS